MADNEVLFAIKQQIMSVDEMIKEREALKIQLADKEVSDKESQTDLIPKLVPKVPKLRNFGTQTEKSEDKSNTTPNTPKISFFRSKNLFAKKQKKRVKFLKKGPLYRENDQKYNFAVISMLPGFFPPPTLTENERVLPNASQMSRLLKRTLSPDRGKNANKKTKKAKLETPTKKSPTKDPKKSPRKNKKEKNPPNSKEFGSKMITETVGGFEPTSPLADIQKHHTELQRSKIEIIPQKNRAEDQQIQGNPNQNVLAEMPKSSKKSKEKPKNLKKSQEEPKNLFPFAPIRTETHSGDGQTTPTEEQLSNKKTANLEQIVKTVEPQPIKTVKPPQVEKTMEPPKPAKTVEPQPPAKTVESAKSKICAKNNLSNLDMIPLGKAHNTPTQRTERCAKPDFKLTPEAMKAIAARKAQLQTGPKKPIPAPINTAKRPSSENNFADPTQRKKFAPARPTPSTAKSDEASSSKKENCEAKTQVKDSRGGMKRLNPKNKGKRNTAESSHGSGDTIDKTNPVDKKCFSVETIDVNQDLMLSDEDEDSEDDQKFSPTKSFKAKRNRIEGEDLVEENPASLLKLDEKKTRENVGGPTTESDSTIDDTGDILDIHGNIDFDSFPGEEETKQKVVQDPTGTEKRTKNHIEEKNLNLTNNLETPSSVVQKSNDNERFGQKVAAENPPLTKLSEEPKNVKNSPQLEEDTSFQATSGSFLQKAFESFKGRNEERKICLLSKFEKARFNSDFDKTMAYNLVKSQFGRLYKCSDFETVSSISNELSKDRGNIEAKRRYIYQHIYMEVREEKEWENVQQFNNGPPMTILQAKLLALLVTLEPKIPGILKQLQEFINESIFGNSMSFRLFQLTSLCRFFLLITRHLGDQRAAKQFLFDTLFFRNTRAHCMLTVLLDTWPEIFLYPNDPNILFETVIWVIYNSGPSQSVTDMKVPEVKQKLSSFRIFGPKYNGDDLIKKLIEHVEKHHADKSERYYVMKSMLLISRVKEYTWAHNHIISRLMATLNKFCNGEDQQAKNLMIWVVDTIGQVFRVYPDKGRAEIEQVFNPITTLIGSENIDAELEESCLHAIIWTGHHLQLQVCKFLASWKPRFKLRPELEEFVSNFVGTRGSYFATNTIIYQKKGHARNNKYNRNQSKVQ